MKVPHSAKTNAPIRFRKKKLSCLCLYVSQPVARLPFDSFCLSAVCSLPARLRFSLLICSLLSACPSACVCLTDCVPGLLPSLPPSLPPPLFQPPPPNSLSLSRSPLLSLHLYLSLISSPLHPLPHLSPLSPSHSFSSLCAHAPCAPPLSINVFAKVRPCSLSSPTGLLSLPALCLRGLGPRVPASWKQFRSSNTASA